jgi:pimeloyl-ACP methyl ester carboxylesterase
MFTQIKRETVQANGAQLYTEVRGSGPSLLFIQGGLGDGAFFERVAELLSDRFTTIIYDRRGNSRSPRPAGWQTTSADEQGDDAAALLRALDLAPAAIYGTSSGGVIGLNLLIRYPNLVRGAMFHEPGLMLVLPDPKALIAQVMPIVEQAMARGGPRAAVEAFVRTVGGDTAYERMPADLRERIVNNGDTMMIEAPLSDYLPSQADLASIRCPVEVLVGTQSPSPLLEMSRWLAAALNAPMRRINAGHAPQLEQPEALAEELRSWLAHLDHPEDTHTEGAVTA